MDLLRSTLPQLAGGDKKFNLYKSDRSKNLVRLKVKTLTPEEIYGSMNATGIKKTLLYIKLKVRRLLCFKLKVNQLCLFVASLTSRLLDCFQVQIQTI